MNESPVTTLEAILKRNGSNVDLARCEEHRYFIFDRIADRQDLDLAWSLFPNNREIRRRADQVDTVSDVVRGWGYRTPKKTNRCSDAKLIEIVRQHIAATQPLFPDGQDDIRTFIERGFDVQIVGRDGGNCPDILKNDLFLALHETMSDFVIDRYPFEQPLLQILLDWATYLTKCNEVAHYLLWPVLRDVDWIDPMTPSPGFELWAFNCGENYWIKNGDLNSATVYVQPAWLN